jgi:hypothetical protein
MRDAASKGTPKTGNGRLVTLALAANGKVAG